MKKIFYQSSQDWLYTKVQSKSSIYKKRLLIKAFQRRFRQGLINGISDQECLILSKNLIKS